MKVRRLLQKDVPVFLCSCAPVSIITFCSLIQEPDRNEKKEIIPHKQRTGQNKIIFFYKIIKTEIPLSW